MRKTHDLLPINNDMGAKPSSLSDLQHNPVLQRLTGEKCVEEDKDFWEELLSFSFRPPYNRYASLSSLTLCLLNHVIICVLVCPWTFIISPICYFQWEYGIFK